MNYYQQCSNILTSVFSEKLVSHFSSTISAKTIKRFQAHLSSAAWFSSLWVWLIADNRVYTFILHNTTPQLLKQMSLELIWMIYRRWLLPKTLNYHTEPPISERNQSKTTKTHFLANYPLTITLTIATKSDKTHHLNSVI